MDRKVKRDLVIGVVTKLSWTELRPYAVSLARCGFEGAKVLLVNGLDTEARNKLAELGFWLVDFELPECFVGHSCNAQTDVPAWTGFGQFRYKPAIDFLAERVDDFRYVIWTDVRDLVFQTDPSSWLEDNLKPPYKLVVARECWLIKDQPHNNQWLKFTAPDEYDELKHHEVLCAGSVAGTSDIMLTLFERIWKAVQVLDPRANDQGVFNWILRKSPFQEVCAVPSMAAGFIATGWSNKRYIPEAYQTDASPVFNAQDYVVYTPDGKTPFSIVHQYDRDQNWKFCIEKIMEIAE
jgi:hypothetical protein